MLQLDARTKYMRGQAANFAALNPATDIRGITNWYRADTTTNSGGFVDQLTDKKGSVQFTQTSTKRPALVASGSDPNGRVCIVFNGTNHALINATGFGAMSDCTVFTVCRSIVAPASSGYMWCIGNTTDAQSVQVALGSTGIRPQVRYANPGSSTSVRFYEPIAIGDAILGTTAPAILVTRHDSAAANTATPVTRARLGMPQPTNQSSGATISTIGALPAAFGGSKTGTSQYMEFGLYEHIVCAGTLLTDDECRQVELYLAGYYGVT